MTPESKAAKLLGICQHRVPIELNCIACECTPQGENMEVYITETESRYWVICDACTGHILAESDTELSAKELAERMGTIVNPPSDEMGAIGG